MTVFSFSTPEEMTDTLCNDFRDYITALNLQKKRITLAFSGGNTPAAFFDKLAENQNVAARRTDWSSVHVFWVDERCVAPGHPESNYTLAMNHLLNKIGIDKKQVHRIRGENEPAGEALRYEGEIRQVFNRDKGIPAFSWIFLGLGDDGHTGSIFPDRLDLIITESICATTRHPVTKQNRVTLTGPIIMKAERTSYLVTGQDKSTIIRQIINREPEAEQYPAFYIQSVTGRHDWYLDAQAAKQLKL